MVGFTYSKNYKIQDIWRNLSTHNFIKNKYCTCLDKNHKIKRNAQYLSIAKFSIFFIYIPRSSSDRWTWWRAPVTVQVLLVYHILGLKPTVIDIVVRFWSCVPRNITFVFPFLAGTSDEDCDIDTDWEEVEGWESSTLLFFLGGPSRQEEVEAEEVSGISPLNLKDDLLPREKISNWSLHEV